MSRDTKLISGITLALLKKLITRDSAEFYEQNRMELYALLDRANYVFNNDKQIWRERAHKRRGPAQVKVMQSPLPAGPGNGHLTTLALIRVIAPAEEMDYIIAQLNELFPCLDAEIVSISKSYPSDGHWIRTYLKVQFNRSVNHE